MQQQDNLQEEKKRLEQIAKFSNIIREKHKLLKANKVTSDEAVNDLFKPIVLPLKKLVDISENDEEKVFTKKIKLDKTIKHDNIDNSFKSAIDNSYNSKPFFSVIDDNDNNSHQFNNIDDIFSSTVNEKINKSLNAMPTTSMRNDSLNNSIHFDQDIENISLIPSSSINKSIRKENTNNSIDKELSISDTHLSKSDQINLTHDYLHMLKSDAKKKNKQFDKIFGVRDLKNGFFIGDKQVNFGTHHLYVNNNTYKLTKGLLELIFKKSPDTNNITNNDYDKYKEIILSTNAHRKNYRADGELRSKEIKFKKFISNMIPQTGHGLPNHMIFNNNKINYIYWDDPNELVDRLRLLMASKTAGHSAHNNEIISIIEELREADIIY